MRSSFCDINMSKELFQDQRSVAHLMLLYLNNGERFEQLTPTANFLLKTAWYFIPTTTIVTLLLSLSISNGLM